MNNTSINIKKVYNYINNFINFIYINNYLKELLVQ